MLEAQGLIDKIEPTVHAVPHGDRSGVVVEPFLTDQWYVDAKTLAQPAIEAVRHARTKFVPPQWEATFFNWMENIQPWCISRQIWWGHQIPAWYGPDGKVFVAETEDDAVADALAHYTEIEEITVEEGHDIALDTRTAGFLPTTICIATKTCSTPGSLRRCGRSRRSDGRIETPELKRYYPTSVLVTGFDIIFFWVARMMMMGLHFEKECRCLHPWWTRLAQNVEVERQRHRSAGADRPVWRRVALHARRHGGAGPRHQRAHCRLPQLCDQALERRAR
jgi:valyl-tRNA synthetase